MKFLLNNKKIEPLKVLVVGNNPIELSAVLEKLNQIRTRKVITEIAFDLKTIFERLTKFQPNFIVIDDNIGQVGLMDVVDTFAANKKTRDVPITVLKNSNYKESLASSHSMLDYVLKQNLSADALIHTLKNALKLKRTQQYLYNAYQRRKKLIMKLQTRSLNLIS